MERYDLYVDEQQLGAALSRPSVLEAAERTRRQLAAGPTCRSQNCAQVCIRLAQTGELRAVWFWTPQGWQAHSAEGWA